MRKSVGKQGDIEQAVPRVLIYDIETCLMLAALFGCGEQVVRHGQLIPGFDICQIICITYAWLDEPGVKVLTWDKETRDDKELIKKFDELVAQADVVIGKNSDRFDAKHVNTQRLLADLPPVPEWAYKCDDLEKQMRRYFYLPSQSLDYISKKMGLGGKTKMDFQDWLDILMQYIYPNVKALKRIANIAFKKMCDYGKKDTQDTKDIIIKVWPHVKFKFNYSNFLKTACCKNCGSKNIRSNGRQVNQDSTIYIPFRCRDCGGYAGRVAENAKPGKQLRS